MIAEARVPFYSGGAATRPLGGLLHPPARRGNRAPANTQVDGPSIGPRPLTGLLHPPARRGNRAATVA